ncbi:unnamed protein product [Caenorhabditis angaria]|uniref:Uncharacterized protein n=1 Tax=Caenorhabditis angaria TaxID=860376 RepID=A0A9P1MS32_9PELO|nr:unnamed protein product [Caenorhabditis angaria]
MSLCCKSGAKSKFADDSGYEVYTISEDALRMKQKMRDKKEGVQLEYVTSRLIVLSCTAETSEKIYLESLSKAAGQIKQNHGTHFRVWNVSQRRHDLSDTFEKVVQFGWPSETAPSLEKLCKICKNIDQWLLEHPLNIAVVFCKSGIERAAIVVNSLMRYNAISATDDSIEDRFNMQRFSERFLGPDGPPSYKRYIGYFTSLLSGRISVNPNPIFLHFIVLKNFEPITVFLKIYERLLPSYQTKSVTLKDTTKFELENSLKLRGDVFLKCIVAASSPGSSNRCLFTCQINTCSIELPAEKSGDFNVVRFHKEELDLIFNDKKVDNRAQIELYLSNSKGPQTIAGQAAQSVITLLPRNNSYEIFEIPEDDSINRSKLEVEYSEIRKKPSIKKLSSEEEDEEEMPVPPPVPPKPSTPLLNGRNGEEFGGEMPERRGILPAQLREKINQKKELEGRATPSIEPDLVGRDRYDKASRCFSYVPAKSMQEAFERPRRTSISRTIEKRENSVENVSQDEAARAHIPQSFTPIHPEQPPKWDQQIEQQQLLEELARAPSSIGQPVYNNGGDNHRYYQQENYFEPAQVFDQAQRAVVTPTSTLQRNGNDRRYGSYRTLNDDAYCSDMDDLCDPDYYLNFSAPPVPPPRQQHAGARSVQLPRKKLNPENFTDQLDDILLEHSKPLSNAYSVGDVRATTENGSINNHYPQQQYRNRNCQSVTNQPRTPLEPVTDSADSWLNGKLRKVKSKRDIDPDLARRRTQEQMLLEELKDGNSSKPRNGMNIDPLAEFRREEERLKNTRSPFDERSGWRGRMRGKPPTPPPREASASPINHRMTPNFEQNRQRFNQSVPLPMQNRHQNNFDDDFDVNSLLNYSHNDNSSTMDRGRSLSRGARIQDAYYASQHDIPNNKFYSGQERVAAAIYRAETPHRDMYASGMTINRAETPGRYFPENSAVLERSATPSFPVNNRSTPLPFHPLLFNQQNNTMNHRSASPRHFQQQNSTMIRRNSSSSAVVEL